MSFNGFRELKFGRQLCFRTTSNGTISGTDIRAPWALGREINFFILTSLASPGFCVFTLQGKRITDGVYENLKEPNGSTDLKFPDSNFVSGGPSDTGIVVGSLDLTSIDTDKYSAIRISCDAGGGAGPLRIIACGYTISGLYEGQNKYDDVLWSRQRYGS